MKRPSRSAVVAVVVILAILAGAGIVVAAVGLGTDGSTAIEVGDTKVAQESVNDELSGWADFPPARARTTAGAVDSRFAATVTTQIVFELLARSWLARQGERVTAADRAAAQDQVGGTQFQQLSPSLQDRYLQRLAVYAALSRLRGEAGNPDAELGVLRREARRVGVTVDPVYGRWAPARANVVPITAPAALANGT